MKVKKGDPLAQIYSPEVYKAKQDYLNALNFNAKRPSPAMVKGSRIKLELLNIDPREIEAIKSTKSVDRHTTLYAPADGWIFVKNINEGSAFKSSMKLFELVDISRVWAETKLYANELAKLDALEDFTVTTEGIAHAFNARKTLLYPKLDPKEATATLRLVIENRDELLKPGMYVTVHASTKTQEHLLVPRTAVIRKDGAWYAFLATEFKGEYLPVKVEVKPLDNTYFEVLNGLMEGDEVVNNALFMMDSDAQINSIY
jgi:Cu(I)/Ag(I) efflux system membrane fusion protein